MDQIKQEIKIMLGEFFDACFAQRDEQAAALYLADELQWIGTRTSDEACGRAQVLQLLHEDMLADPEPFEVVLSNDNIILLADAAAVFSCDMLLYKQRKAALIKLAVRFTAACQRTDDMWKIASVHASVGNSSATLSEFFPSRSDKNNFREVDGCIADKSVQLLSRNIPGGMMGGYCEKGFPLYHINEKMLGYLGYTYEEFVEDIQGLILNCMHPEDVERVDRIASEAMASDTDYEVQYRMKKKDGSYIWVNDIGHKIITNEGREACISVIHDISAEIEAKQRLYAEISEKRDQKNMLQYIIDNMPGGLLQCSYERIPKALMINKTGAEILGFENESEFFSHKDMCDNILRCIHQDDRAKVLEEIFSITEAGIVKNSSHRIKTAAGIEKRVRSAACIIQNQQGEKVYQIIFHDVTEILQLRRKNEQWNMMERSALYTAITLAYPMIIFGNLTQNTSSVLENEGEVLHSLDCSSYDAMIEAVAGKVEPEFKEEFLGKFERGNQLAEYADGAKEVYMEHRQLLDDGQYHWVSVHKIKVDNPVNDDVLTVSLIRCIDEQKNNEAEQNQILRTALCAAETSNNAKTEFLSRMSHEIRTPMNAIIGMTAIALTAVDNKERINDCLTKIGISARFLLSLINDILDMSRIESGRMILTQEEFDFVEMVNGLNSLIYPQAESKGVEFNSLIEGVTEDKYIGDSLRLRQILLNILSNALKFTPPGGRIQFTVRQLQQVDKEVWLRFTVNDTGIGMSKSFQSRLFEAFEQENPNISIKYGGTGLGLAICKNLVNLMGGSINVHSIEGVGSEFSVEVKLGLTESSCQQKPTDVLKNMNLKVLVIDDDNVTGEHASLIIEDLGMEAKYVKSGFMAINEFRSSIEQRSAYDIVLVDLRMPDMNGIETARALRDLSGADALIIVMTAYEWKEIEEEARHAGVDFFISKPLFRSELLNLFEKVNDSGERKVCEQIIAKKKIKFMGERILLVEDNELNLEVAATLLEMQGLVIESAANGLEALEKFCSSPVGYYNAILMDIRMPVMDGLEAAGRIRRLDKLDAATIPIIAMTANAFDEDVENSKAAGMNAHLGKPIDPQKMFEVLQEFIC